VSDEEKKTGENPAVLRRYQRRGGTARKDEPARGGLWQRVRNWVGSEKPDDDDEDYYPEAAPTEDLSYPPQEPELASPPPPPQAEPPQAQVQAPQEPPRAPTPEPTRPPAGPSRHAAQRLAVELVLPDEQRLVLLVTAPHGREGGLLQLRVEPPPANARRIVEGLTAIGRGETVEEPPIRTSSETPVSADAHARQTRPSAEVPPADTPRGRAPAPAAEARPRKRSTTSPGMPVVDPPILPPLEPAGMDEIELPPPERAQQPRPRRQTGDTLMGFQPPPGELPVDEEPAPEPQQPPPARQPPPAQPAQPAPAPAQQAAAAQQAAEAQEPKRRRLRPAAARGGAAEVLYDEKTRAPEPEPEPARPEPARKLRPTAPSEPIRSPAAKPPPDPTPEPAPTPAFPVDLPREDLPRDELYPPSAQQLAPPAAEPMAPLLSGEEIAPDEMGFRRGLRSSQLPVVGIDFGTSYSSIALMRAGLEIIPDEKGDPLLPSVISFPKAGESLIGWEARRRMGGEAQFTIVSPKRLLGRLYKDPQVAQLIGGLAFRTFAGTDKFVRFEAHGEIYSVTDICALILGKLRERACRYLDAEVSKAVFAVPVGFGTLQRSALEVAARKAGLEPVGLVTEPSAAVLAHGFRSQRGVVVVYDFGGGTFDFSVLEVSETAFQVLCAGGDPWLGGDDFDNAMASNLADRFWKETGVDLRNRAVEWQALLFACEHAKRILSTKSAAEVRVDNLLHTSKGAKGLRYKLSRREFVKLVEPLIEKSITISKQVMQQAGISQKQVDGVVLTGGTSMIPAVRDAVSKCFKRKPAPGDPDLAVVRGASLRAAELSGEAISDTSMGGRTLKEVAGRTIGAGPKGGRVVTLFERDTPVPAEVFKAFYTQYDDQTEMVIGLYEESKSRVDESRTIGHLRYKGLRAAPAGQARIDFTFVLDEDGILHVTAVVEGKEYEKSIRLS
jgi:molecular chaperone DnaK